MIIKGSHVLRTLDILGVVVTVVVGVAAVEVLWVWVMVNGWAA
jgi:hypothetical protein